jgi:hypothetical protein
MDARTAVMSRFLVMTYTLFSLMYGVIATFFLVSGVSVPSSGSVLIGLGCLSGMSLFLTPLWLMREVKRHHRVVEEVLKHYAKPGD